MSQIEIKNLIKKHGQNTILHGLNISINSGEFVVFVGPSGCGKSTTLRLIAGLEEITEGDISIGGKVVNTVPPRDRDIAMVFQNYALYPHMNVRENMAFSLKMRKANPAEIDKKVKEASELLGLDDLLDRRPGQLSGGQRQRVAMGRAIVRNPLVFLFDEPLSNLDAKLRNQMRAEIKKLHERLKTTTIYVTHDQVEAMTLADRIVLLRKGVIEQMGSPTELYNKPANMFVASFLGNPSMNFLTAEIQNGKLLCAGQEIGNVSDYKIPTNYSENKIVIGIRPECVKDGSEGPQSINGNLDLVEILGANTLVHSVLSNKTRMIGFSKKYDYKTNTQISLSFDPKDCHLFNPTSEQRVL
ncbi:MAG: sn-glycerol-3-phosphate ABC transporter ATP-binding protein UgpC [Bdellovibrionota bacterium]